MSKQSAKTHPFLSYLSRIKPSAHQLVFLYSGFKSISNPRKQLEELMLLGDYGSQPAPWPLRPPHRNTGSQTLGSALSHPWHTLTQGWSILQPIELGRNDVWLLQLSHKRHWSVYLGLLDHLLWGKPSPMSWGHSSSPMKRPIWRGTNLPPRESPQT